VVAVMMMVVLLMMTVMMVSSKCVLCSSSNEYCDKCEYKQDLPFHDFRFCYTNAKMLPTTVAHFLWVAW